MLLPVFVFASVRKSGVTLEAEYKVYLAFFQHRRLSFPHGDTIGNLHDDSETVPPVDVS